MGFVQLSQRSAMIRFLQPGNPLKKKRQVLSSPLSFEAGGVT